MADRRSVTLLLVLALPVWGVGLYYSVAEGERQVVSREARKWYARYDQLKPYLEGEDKVGMALDPKERGKGRARLFRAQYVLAPTVIRLWPKLPEVRHRRLAFIYDFARQDRLDKTLAAAATQAQQTGIDFQAEKLGRGLAVVTMKKAARSPKP